MLMKWAWLEKGLVVNDTEEEGKGQGRFRVAS